MVKTYIDELAEEIATLREENRQLRKWCEEFNALNVAQENQKLKELLKRCRDFISYEVPDHCIDDILIDKIDEVLNEKL